MYEIKLRGFHLRNVITVVFLIIHLATIFRSYDHLQVEICTSEITLLTTDPLFLGYSEEPPFQEWILCPCLRSGRGEGGQHEAYLEAQHKTMTVTISTIHYIQPVFTLKEI
jgi:hypothetical protein